MVFGRPHHLQRITYPGKEKPRREAGLGLGLMPFSERELYAVPLQIASRRQPRRAAPMADVELKAAFVLIARHVAEVPDAVICLPSESHLVPENCP